MSISEEAKGRVAYRRSFSKFPGLSFVSIISTFCLILSIMVGVGSRTEAVPHPTASYINTAGIYGRWYLDESRSESLSSFLVACGAPRLVCPLLAKAFDRDFLEIEQPEDDHHEVSIALKRKGWGLPVKLQTDAVYATHGETTIETPRGPQRGRLLKRAEDLLHIHRLGPSENEHVEELYHISGDDLKLTLKHISPSRTVVVHRHFRRGS